MYNDYDIDMKIKKLEERIKELQTDNYILSEKVYYIALVISTIIEDDRMDKILW